MVQLVDDVAGLEQTGHDHPPDQLVDLVTQRNGPVEPKPGHQVCEVGPAGDVHAKTSGMEEGGFQSAPTIRPRTAPGSGAAWARTTPTTFFITGSAARRA